MNTELFDIGIVGAGVVGLAIAQRLASSPAFKNSEIVLLEQDSAFGQHISSRSSEVIHGGIYYPEDSLKARFCVRGKQLLYEHCEHYQIPCNRLGKLIVAQPGEEASLQALLLQAQKNGVGDLQSLDGDQLIKLEPALSASAALHSPSTGIIDSHSYMLSLLQLAQDKGVMFAPQTRVIAIEHVNEKFVLNAEIGKSTDHEEYQFSCRYLINSAGLAAQALANRIAGLPGELIPALHYCKGDYFNYLGKSPFSRLIYPLPEQNTRGLGVHSTLDMSGQLRFGPDTEFVDSVNYDIDPSKAGLYATAIGRYFPQIDASKLEPAYAGIRPKLSLGDSFEDFQILYGAEHGFPGLIQLFGIESPGLTASLAIADELVCHMQNL